MESGKVEGNDLFRETRAACFLPSLPAARATKTAAFMPCSPSAPPSTPPRPGPAHYRLASTTSAPLTFCSPRVARCTRSLMACPRAKTRRRLGSPGPAGRLSAEGHLCLYQHEDTSAAPLPPSAPNLCERTLQPLHPTRPFSHSPWKLYLCRAVSQTPTDSRKCYMIYAAAFLCQCPPSTSPFPKPLSLLAALFSAESLKRKPMIATRWKVSRTSLAPAGWTGAELDREQRGGGDFRRHLQSTAAAVQKRGNEEQEQV